MRRLLLVVSVAALTGCSGTLRTEPFDAANFTTNSNSEAIEGIIHYAPAYLQITYQYTMRVENGRVVGTADNGGCKPTNQKEEVRILPNFNRAYRVYQDAGVLSSDKFSVTLSNGILTAVGSESAPKGAEAVASLGELASGAGAIIQTSVEEPVGAEPYACNASPVIARLTPINPFEDTEMAVSSPESDR